MSKKRGRAKFRGGMLIHLEYSGSCLLQRLFAKFRNLFCGKIEWRWLDVFSRFYLILANEEAIRKDGPIRVEGGIYLFSMLVFNIISAFGKVKNFL